MIIFSKPFSSLFQYCSANMSRPPITSITILYVGNVTYAIAHDQIQIDTLPTSDFFFCHLPSSRRGLPTNYQLHLLLYPHNFFTPFIHLSINSLFPFFCQSASVWRLINDFSPSFLFSLSITTSPDFGSSCL